MAPSRWWPRSESGREAAGLVLGLGLGVALWWALAARVGPLLLPTPVAVLDAIWTERSRLLLACTSTASAAGVGLLAAALLGVTLASASWWSRGVASLILPYVTLLQVLPIVAIAPLLVVWLGYGTGVATVTALIAAFYPVYASTGTGLRAPGANLTDLLRLYGASRAHELWLLRLPSALPSLMAGLRTAGGLSVIGAIVGEFVGSNGQPPTLGFLVLYGARSARPDLAFAAISGAAALALGVQAGVRLLERRTIGRWYGR